MWIHFVFSHPFFFMEVILNIKKKFQYQLKTTPLNLTWSIIFFDVRIYCYVQS